MSVVKFKVTVSLWPWSSFIVNSSLLYLVTSLGDGDDQQGFQSAMAVVAIVCFVLCFWATRERVIPAQERAEETLWDNVVGIFKDFISLLKHNREWAIVATATFFLLLIAVMRGGSTLYYTKYFLQSEPGTNMYLGLISYDMCNASESGTAFLTIGTLGSIAGAILTIFMTRRVCKTVIFKTAAIGFIASSVALYFIAPTMMWSALTLNTSIGFFHIIMISLVFAMTADSGEYVTGKRATAMTFSGHLFALKLGAAIGGYLLGLGIGGLWLSGTYC